MSPSGMAEIPRLQTKRKSVMPAQAGIQVDVTGITEPKTGFPLLRE